MLLPAELVVERADANQLNMALTSWKGNRVGKPDVINAKNYLDADEIDTLNRLVVIFLEQAELRVKQQRDLTLKFWQNNLDRMLEYNDRVVLEGAGAVSHDDISILLKHVMTISTKNVVNAMPSKPTLPI